eukprot:3454890-Pleurochrysis_carterae.AAC.1
MCAVGSSAAAVPKGRGIRSGHIRHEERPRIRSCYELTSVARERGVRARFSRRSELHVRVGEHPHGRRRHVGEIQVEAGRTFHAHHARYVRAVGHEKTTISVVCDVHSQLASALRANQHVKHLHALFDTRADT